MSSKALQPGSVILITGVNGYLAGEVAKQLIEQGYHVRGTARDQAKLDIVAKAFEQHKGAFEGIVVKDMTGEGALDHIVTGVDGIVHVASDVSFGFDPNQIVAPTIKAMERILAIAAKHPQVKRFVYTSSAIAVTPQDGDASSKKTHHGKDSWNEVDVKKAWAEPPYTQERAVAVYGASKVGAEKAGWDFVKANKPGFVFNVVNPSLVAGPLAFPGQNPSSSGWIAGGLQGDESALAMLQNLMPVWMVDNRDIGRLHLAALLDPKVANERLFGFAETLNYSQLVKLYKNIEPSREWPAPQNDDKEQRTMDVALETELLKQAGQKGFIGFEQSLREQLVAI